MATKKAKKRAVSADVTARATAKVRGRPFPPGVSGNPAGRPVGSRNRLSEKFLAGLEQLYDEGGIEALRRVMLEDPVAFMQSLSKLVPTRFGVEENQSGGGFIGILEALGKASASKDD